MRIPKFVLFCLSIIYLSSCASPYKSIHPNQFNLINTEVSEGVTLKYQYDILRNRGNKKFAKDEAKSNLKIVAVEIINTSEQPLVLGENLKITAQDKEIQIADPFTVTKSIKQCAGCYIPYALLTFVNLYTVSSTGKQETYRIGYGLGPGITLYNILTASSANKKLKRILLEKDLVGKEILPGESKRGLISIYTRSFETLKPKISN